ncbi:XRE family transcriptional regulator [Rhodomicrobium sp. Az07]|uniref:helix-turn-helix domain-containing protein n=1 Tax=Rhodomicrobium sp. Az07 TaxID=2839034 RepID=UPI001BEB5377|nr:XRE family transcriptional regulator [Rhodomicrobium sp. Az07]MBT3069568.1 XRE family transcriptional regulator [Rhodomicrobium sp. Az07]
MNKRFNGQLLALARQVRKVSQAELVAALNGAITQSTLSKIEHGRIQPQDDLVEQIASALRLRSAFFFDGVYVRQAPVSYHRKRQKLSVRDEESVHALAEVFRINLRKCLEAVEIQTTLPPIPAIDPDEYGGDVDEIATVLRQRWSVPRGPIADLTKIVEDAGVVIIVFDFGSPLIDGFCQFGCDGLPPFVFLNSQQPKDRFRFSLAHEVGHLVMHRTPNPQQEFEANRFASEFLMPTREIRCDFEDLSLTKFMDLKMYWGVSMQALIYKAWQVGKLSDRMYKYYNIEMSKRGFRKVEPIEAKHLREEPTTLRWIISAHIDELGFSVDDLGELFGLNNEDVTSLYPVPNQRPRLRIVRSEHSA